MLGPCKCMRVGGLGCNGRAQQEVASDDSVNWAVVVTGGGWLWWRL